MRIALGLAIVLAANCASGCRTPEPDSEQQLHAKLLQIASVYESWGRVDDDMRFAPELCDMPSPGTVYFSRSADADTHGTKLYSLFAKNRQEYQNLKSEVGQVIVKESWLPEQITNKEPGDIDRSQITRTGRGGAANRFYPFATRGDKVYKAAKPAGLFIMMKLDPTTPGTDDGWVYGTVTADGKTVTACGKVESCMKCHQEAKHDRLFGLPPR